MLVGHLGVSRVHGEYIGAVLETLLHLTSLLVPRVIGSGEVRGRMRVRGRGSPSSHK